MRLTTGSILLALLVAACSGGEGDAPVAPAVVQADPAVAERVRRLAAPSVVGMQALRFESATAQHVQIGQGSAVAMGGGVFLTSCRNLVGADHVVLREGRVREMATLAEDYVGDDVCVLDAPDLLGTPVLAVRDIAGIQPGEPVFAVADAGAAVARGEVTAKRQGAYGVWIDTSLAVSPKWAGAGLFDAQGAFIGIAGAAADGPRGAAFALQTPIVTQVLARSAVGVGVPVVAGALVEPAAGPTAALPRGAASLSPEERASLERYFAQQDSESSTGGGAGTGAGTGTPGGDVAPGGVGGGDDADGGDTDGGDTGNGNGGGDGNGGSDDGNGGSDDGNGGGDGGNGGSDGGNGGGDGGNGGGDGGNGGGDGGNGGGDGGNGGGDGGNGGGDGGNGGGDGGNGGGDGGNGGGNGGNGGDGSGNGGGNGGGGGGNGGGDGGNGGGDGGNGGGDGGNGGGNGGNGGGGGGNGGGNGGGGNGGGGNGGSDGGGGGGGNGGSDGGGGGGGWN